jgi:hypothetical protein
MRLPAVVVSVTEEMTPEERKIVEQGLDRAEKLLQVDKREVDRDILRGYFLGFSQCFLVTLRGSSTQTDADVNELLDLVERRLT